MHLKKLDLETFILQKAGDAKHTLKKKKGQKWNCSLECCECQQHWPVLVHQYGLIEMHKCKLTACSALGDLVICERSSISCEYLNFQRKFTLLWSIWALNCYLIWGKATCTDSSSSLMILTPFFPVLWPREICQHRMTSCWVCSL